MVSHPQLTKPQQRQKRILNLICLSIFCFVLLLIVCVFSSLGDGLALQGLFLLKSAQAGVKSLPPLPFFKPCPANMSNHLPCFDPKIAVNFPRAGNEFRERHCPDWRGRHRCLVPPPPGYRIPISWPDSVHKVWFDNVPHTRIAEDQDKNKNWMRQSGDVWEFPGGGTMFPEGVDKYVAHIAHYVNFDDKLRTCLDIGAGVGSFGAALMERRVLALSVAPKDAYRGQVQFALERGVPAMLGILATSRLPFPSRAFDLIHCAGCSVTWTSNNGTHLFEADRLIRPGGYFVLAGQPVEWKGLEAEWRALQRLASALCWEQVKVVGNVAVWRKRLSSDCKVGDVGAEAGTSVPVCKVGEDPDNAWNIKLKACAVPSAAPTWVRESWPQRLSVPSPRVQLLAPPRNSGSGGSGSGGIQQWISGSSSQSGSSSSSSGSSGGGGSSSDGIGGGSNFAGRVELASEGSVKSVGGQVTEGDGSGGQKGGDDDSGSSSGSSSSTRRRLLGSSSIGSDGVSRSNEELPSSSSVVAAEEALRHDDPRVQRVLKEDGGEAGGGGGGSSSNGVSNMGDGAVGVGVALNALDPRPPSRLEAEEQQRLMEADSKRWRRRVKFYKANFLKKGFLERRFRNVLDMNAGIGGFGAGMQDYPVWVMNVVPSTAPANTLPAIFDRGLIGTQHDWCEAFSSYPRTFDLIHVHDFTALQPSRCSVIDVVLEMDRLLRPGGMVVVRDLPGMLAKVEQAARAMFWSTKVSLPESKSSAQRVLVARKAFWTLDEEGKMRLPLASPASAASDEMEEEQDGEQQDGRRGDSSGDAEGESGGEGEKGGSGRL